MTTAHAQATSTTGMTPTPSVSVIVPVFNGAATIADCVQSLLALSTPPKPEVLVVDNGSTDSTLEQLTPFVSHVRVLHERRRGPSAARNKGLAEAAGDIVAFTDADCVVDSEWLRHLIVPLQDPAVGVAGGAIRARPIGNAIEHFGENVHDHEYALCRERPPYAITMSWASRRTLLRELEGFDVDLRRMEDVDLSYRVFAAGYRFVFCPDAVVYHHNERTLYGLFEEGFLHGWYSVPALKKHRPLLTATGHARVTGTALKLALAAARRWAAGSDPTAACAIAFNGGKQLGKIVGSARFRSLAL